MDQEQFGKILIYQNEKGNTKVDVYFEDDTIWMTQKSMADLYQTTPQNITLHIKNIYSDNELDRNQTCKDSLQVQLEGQKSVTRTTKFYNLQVILAVGYRIRNNVGVHFRNWATSVLSEYMKKGFALNDARLKNPKEFGADYFDELLERIRDIRSSEKRFYLKVKDIFTTSIDYDAKAEIAKNFFASVQNKLHFAAHGQTAAELIASRADASKPNMGLTTFEGAKVRKQDISVAKNYLNKEELETLNLIVSMYLDYAELQARERRPMHMKDWEQKLNAFLQFNDRSILKDRGKIAHDLAKKIAEEQYAIFDAHRKELDVEELTIQVKHIKN